MQFQKTYLDDDLCFDGEGLISTGIGSFVDKSGRPTVVVGRLNCFVKRSTQRRSRRFWERTDESSYSLITAPTRSSRGPVFLIGR